MAIAVICPGCKQSFRVSDKFAGKEGPCPKCKATIKIPKESTEVKVHGPEAYASGGRDSTGRPTARPIRRTQTKFNRLVVLGGVAAAALVMLGAWLLGDALRASLGLRAIGLMALTPPTAVLGYIFFRDMDTLERFTGTSLWIRAAICSAAYLALWVALGWVQLEYEFPQAVWQWFVVAPSMFLLGAIAALGCFDLEFGSAFIHYAFYVGLVLLLRFIAGAPPMWELGI